MTNPAGSFIWYELMTPNPDASNAFYGAVVGWNIVAHSGAAAGDIDYHMIVREDGGMAGGAVKLTAEMTSGGARPCWLPYVYAPDVDAAVAAIEADGGKLQLPPIDLDVGRIAMVTDPQGVPIYLMDPIPPAGLPATTSDVFDENAAQRVRWNELASPDPAASKAFYAKHFAFGFNEAMPMGAMGDCSFIDHYGRRLGAIMQRQDERQPALWLLYFGVPSIAAAKAAIEENGGQVVMGPHEVPGCNWIVVGIDPHGATFGLVGDKGD